MSAEDAGKQIAASLFAAICVAVACYSLLDLTIRQTVATYLLIAALGAASRG